MIENLIIILNTFFNFLWIITSAIDFEAVDNKPVDLVFMLISPETNGADHLTALATLSRILKNDETCEKLRKAKSKEEIYAILNS